MPSKIPFVVSALITLQVAAIQQYGHAYATNDFTPDQYTQIANTFPIFTIEKRHAYTIYGDASQSGANHYKSIAATIGTANKIKAINKNVKVLMYWNTALHYNMYECETQVVQSWLMPGTASPPLYDYANADFRTWWVKCAVDAI